MSTRSLIALALADGKIAAIYCHSDGYVESPGVGYTLNRWWTDPMKVAKLIGLGNLSCLGPDLGKRHSFERKTKPGMDRNAADSTLTTAYGRDRGDADSKALTFAPSSLFREAQSWDAEYLYLMDKNGAWKVTELGGTKPRWSLLSTALETASR